MGRPPSNGGPSFRFNPSEVAEMEAILQAHNTQVPARELLVELAEKFSNSSDRSGKVTVQMKQVWNWFQNRRYALRAKAAKVPMKLSVSPIPPSDLAAVRNVPQAPQHISVPPTQVIVRSLPQVLQPIYCPPVQVGKQNGSDNSFMEFEAKSTRDGAWYDVATFISHRSAETAEPVIPDAIGTCGIKRLIQEVLVRFAGLGQEEDEWVNIRKHVRQRSLPCEASECVAVLPGDLILCFQEGKEQALYFDAHVLDAQRRRHDVRGCRCRFLVRYDHDQSEEIVPLKKVCRRPETDYRMQQLHSESASMSRNKTVPEPHAGNTVIYPSSEAIHKLQKAEATTGSKEQPPKVEVLEKPVLAPISSNAATSTVAMPHAIAGVSTAEAQSIASVDTTTTSIAHSNVSGTPRSAATTTDPIVHFNVSGAIVTSVNATAPVAQSVTSKAIPAPSGMGNSTAQLNISAATPPTASTINPAIDFLDSSVTSTIAAPVTLCQHVASGPTSSVLSLANAATQVNESQVTIPKGSLPPVTLSNTSEATVSTDTKIEPTVQLVEPQANVSAVTAAPVTHSVTAGIATSVSQDENSDVSGLATSVVTATMQVGISEVAGATDSVVPTTTTVAGNSDAVATTAAGNSDVAGLTAAPTSQDANSVVPGSSTSAVTTTLLVANPDATGTTDSVVTTTTRVPNAFLLEKVVQ